ncbi:hypothetical protein BGW36DRAFT_383597 [Talaromyces proteolyticus]|uniref:Zn(2)-C6 fungal-type domain-containing protein n=1 Tax=Talaromyces proteolyticus TaxID=1131652 RepID=A0AAD4KQ98_9EURO|nr:uncharacterized protein BGW36DRAFT_383597 [Talaromyces proteolyticus]KAH8693734.1 hypothetical protein BGW36DRAFT_383597 [Talaromyces proteolyticus]
MAVVMNDSFQQLLHAATEPDFQPPDAAVLSAFGIIGSGSDSGGEVTQGRLETATVRRRPAPRGTAAYPRKRANRACQVCRARRTKCDNKKPSCSFCEKVGAKCITTPTDLSSFDPASLAILDRLEQLEQLIREKSTVSNSQLPPPPPAPAPVEEFTLSYGSPAPDLHFGPDFSTVTIETVLAWDVFRGRFNSQLDLKSLLRDVESPPSPNTSPVGETIPLINSLELGSCNRLLDSFLVRVHIANPILDIGLARGYMNHACIHGVGWDAQSCLVLLVCALGSIAEAFHDVHGHTSLMTRNSPSFTLARVFFEASQKRIGLLLRGSGVLEAQCFFYSGVYLMTIQQPMDAWKHFVQAAAISQGFDFPKKPFMAELLTDEDLRRERAAQESIYWTCFKSELEVRMELSLPGFGLQDLSYPSSFPSPPSDDLGQDSAHAWYYYLAEIALRRLANRILYNLFRNQDNGRFPRIIELVESTAAFEAQAADWMASLPPVFSLQTPEEEDDVLKFVLRGHLLDCYEWMYFPFMAETINFGRRGPILDEYTRKGLQMCADRIRKNEPGFQHRHHGAWLMLRTCTRSALILLAACHSQMVQDLMPEGWKEAVVSAMGMLQFWEDEVGDARDRLHILTVLMTELGWQ